MDQVRPRIARRNGDHGGVGGVSARLAEVSVTVSATSVLIVIVCPRCGGGAVGGLDGERVARGGLEVEVVGALTVMAPVPS